VGQARIMTFTRRDMIRFAAAAAVIPVGEAVAAVTADEDRFAAFCAGFPLFEFARTAYVSARPRTAGGAWILNRPMSRRSLSDPAMRQITAVNNDCLVTNARIDLSGGPVVVEIPDIPDRYFSAAFMDAFTDNFFFAGTRASGGRGGRFAILPPGWPDDAVPEGAYPVRAATSDVWMLIRILIDGPEDVAAVNALQDAIRIEDAATRKDGPILPVEPGDIADAGNFLAVVKAMLDRCDPGDPRALRARRFPEFSGAMPPAQDWPAPLLRSWRTAIADGLTRLAAASSNERRIDGWSYSADATGDFGENEEERARVALVGLAALPPEEALYAHGLADDHGEALRGDRNYRLRLPPGGVPVKAFWSLTMYSEEADGRLYLVPNPISRYSIGDRTRSIRPNRDGSIDILFQREAPEAAMAGNWLPTPGGAFRPLFRGYLALPALRSLAWRLPAIERVA